MAAVVLLAIALPGVSCRTERDARPNPRPEPPQESAPPLRLVQRIDSWGTLREVLRDGNAEPRVKLAGLAERDAIGVGALPYLAGEITIAGGRTWIATVDGDECTVTEAPLDAMATLLLRAEVGEWEGHEIADCETYERLESAIADELAERGIDRSSPIPVRVRGHAARVHYHVIDGACPVANPSGPSPWRFSGPIDEVEIVGFFVEGAAGRWTHHARRSHLHVIGPGRTGHLDEVSIRDAVLYLPAYPSSCQSPN